MLGEPTGSCGEAKDSAAQAADHLEAVQPSKALDQSGSSSPPPTSMSTRPNPGSGKQPESARLAQVVYTALETLRYLGIMLWPFMPNK